MLHLLGAVAGTLCVCGVATEPWWVAAEARITPPVFPDRVFDITKQPFGAKADGHTDVREAIKAAVRDANLAGGGTVLVPPGDYLVAGPVHLKSDVELRVEVRPACIEPPPPGPGRGGGSSPTAPRPRSYAARNTPPYRYVCCCIGGAQGTLHFSSEASDYLKEARSRSFKLRAPQSARQLT